MIKNIASSFEVNVKCIKHIFQHPVYRKWVPLGYIFTEQIPSCIVLVIGSMPMFF